MSFFNPPWPHELLDKLLRRVAVDDLRRRTRKRRARHRPHFRQAPAADPGGRNRLRNKARLDRLSGAMAAEQEGRPQEGPQGRTLQQWPAAGGRRATWSRSRPTGCAGRRPISGSCADPDSGIWVAEIDIKPNEGIDGAAALAWLEEINGKLPDTLMAITPSGSIHRYFNWPRDGRDIRNSASKVGRGIDVRGNGGMVIAPPSMRNGRRYRWINEARRLPTHRSG